MMYRTSKQGLSDIYVVGCGQSLQGFAWHSLKDKTTIAVNGSVIDVPNADYFLTADSGFACKASKANFWGSEAYKVLVMDCDHDRFQFVKKYLPLWNHRIPPRYFDGNIGFSESEFATGQNSGFCGMQLAVILGAKKIHLLGMDFCGEGKGNYHNRYPSNPKVWDEFLTHFKTAVDILTKHDIEVVSHSAISKLNEVVTYEKLQ